MDASPLLFSWSIRKKLILLTDLPEAAQRKLIGRRRMRSEMNALHDLMVGEQDIL